MVAAESGAIRPGRGGASEARLGDARFTYAMTVRGLSNMPRGQPIRDPQRAKLACNTTHDCCTLLCCPRELGL